jgi:hypothetical protein
MAHRSKADRPGAATFERCLAVEGFYRSQVAVIPSSRCEAERLPNNGLFSPLHDPGGTFDPPAAKVGLFRRNNN